MNKKYSVVGIRKDQSTKRVTITSNSKPTIAENVIAKWQALVDLIANSVNVPSCLIMKLNSDTIEVFMKSKTKGNPYKVGEQARLVYSLYCETVIGTQEKLLVPDARESAIWKDNNPDVDIDMVSYLGFPVSWPDGEVFGTVCLLDNKLNHYNESFEAMLYQLKQHIETDLNLLVSNINLQKANEELVELNATKDKFFSIIAHDLKNPFNSMLGLSERLMNYYDHYDDDKRKKFITVLAKSINNTYSLLDNLLIWSRSQKNAIEFRPQKLNLHFICNEVCEFLEEMSSAKNIELVNTIETDKRLMCDREMMATVIRNLVSNAIKFTPSNGKIVIESKFIPTQHNDMQTIITVTDNGIGMSELVKKSLFKIAENESTRGTEGEEGTGLGLIICAEFVDKHGGDIWVDSIVGEGTTFSFSVPAYVN